jgi:uncharacterized protein YjeT (DUF2065 family)
VSAAAVGARRVGLAQVGASTANRRALNAAINPPITRLARAGLASMQVGALLGVQRSVFAGLASDINRFGAHAQIDSLTRAANEAVGVTALSKAVQGIGASIATDFAR